nr:hypothetical protein [Tanacetum cinerariifolium]
MHRIDSSLYGVLTTYLLILRMALPPRDQRHQYLRFEGLRYTNADITDFKERLGRIYGREIHQDAQGQSVFTSRAWMRLFKIRGLLVHELILEFFITFRFRKAVLDLDMVGALQFQLGGVRRCISWRQFILSLRLHTAKEMESAGFDVYWDETLSYTLIKDPMLRLCHRLIACNIAERSHAPKKVTVIDLFYLRGIDVGSVNIPYTLYRYLRLFALGRKREGLTVIVRDLPMIDMAELMRLQIYEELDDTWAWVAPRPKRHLNHLQLDQLGLWHRGYVG